MFKRGVLGFAVLAALIATSRSEAVLEDGWLVLQGSRTASVTLTLPTSAELLVHTMARPGDRHFDRDEPRITGGRDLAGFLVTDERGAVVLYDMLLRVSAPVEVPASPGREPRGAMQRIRDGYLPPRSSTGIRRYTFTLLADAPVTVRIGVRRMRGQTLRPSKTLPVEAHRLNFTPTAREPRGEARVPVTLRGSSAVLLYTDHAMTGIGDGHQWLCLTPPDARCADDAPFHSHRTYGWFCLGPCLHVREDDEAATHWGFAPRRAGRYDAVARSYASWGVVTDQRATVLVIG